MKTLQLCTFAPPTPMTHPGGNLSCSIGQVIPDFKSAAFPVCMGLHGCPPLLTTARDCCNFFLIGHSRVLHLLPSLLTSGGMLDLACSSKSVAYTGPSGYHRQDALSEKMSFLSDFLTRAQHVILWHAALVLLRCEHHSTWPKLV